MTDSTTFTQKDSHAGEKSGLKLNAEEEQVLRDRAIDPAYALRLGCHSIKRWLDVTRARKYGTYYPGLVSVPDEVGGLLIPYDGVWDPSDRIERFRFRVTERTYYDKDENRQEAKRYYASTGASVIPFWTPGLKDIAGDVTKPIFATEAPLKAMSLDCNGFPAFGMGGVSAGAHDPKEPEIIANEDFKRINWRGRRLYIAYDATIVTKPGVALGAAYLAICAQELGADVWLVRVPMGHPEDTDIEEGVLFSATDQGPDDYIAKHGREAFQRLVDEALPMDPTQRLDWTAPPNETHPQTKARAATYLADLPTVAYWYARGPRSVEIFQAKSCGVGTKSIRAEVLNFAKSLKPKTEVPEWAADMLASSSGVPTPCVHNGLLAVRNDPKLKGVFAHDELLGGAVLMSEPPWANHGYKQGRPVDDFDIVRFTAYMHEVHNLNLKTPMMHEVVDTASHERAFHPVRTWLESLKWDQPKALEGVNLTNWMQVILGAEDTEYVRTIARKSLIQMVSRAYRPGLLAKSTVILEGAQNAKKSTFVRELCSPWYTDQLPSNYGDKDASQCLQGVWGVEIPELAGKKSSEIETVKKFMSQVFDRFRPSYGRKLVTRQRTCVFWGTTNEFTYLKDSTGNVRWWPVKVGTIDIEKLKAVRDQLFAEAVVAFKAGETWWLDTEEQERDAADEAAQRRHPDPWESKIAKFLEDKDDVDIADVLSELNIDSKSQNRGDSMRVATVLQFLGWEKGKRGRSDVGYTTRYKRPAGTKAVEPATPRPLCAADAMSTKQLMANGWTVEVLADGRRCITEPAEGKENIIQLFNDANFAGV
jgi:predicted P-loop ATPase